MVSHIEFIKTTIHIMLLKSKTVLLSVVTALLVPFCAQAQNITVSGTITDQSGETVSGAAVMVLNTTTEQSGFSMAVNFAMRLKAIDARIEFKQQITKEIPLIISGM